MLCSARELGLSEDHSGLLVLDARAPIGEDVRAALALDDRRMTVKLTPNRADCLSVVGIAREVAALTGAPLVLPSIARVPPQSGDRLPVRVEAPDLCGRFSGRVIRGVDASAPTPGWMKQRLERSGQRPISALVDISNYVMLELGRPSHVFDLDKVSGGLTVRWGRAGERVELLNGQTIEVDGGVGVIADDRGVEALAGVMGGQATAVSLDTRNIYVEAAFWWPDAIRGRARRFNFSTDAAHRFERGVDYATTVEHIEYITRLIVEICGGAPGPVDDTVLGLPARPPVTMRIERCRRILGMPLAADDMADAFRRLGLAFVRDNQAFTVTPPSFRFDLEIEEDLIEEVARVYGFENIPTLPPVAPSAMLIEPEHTRSLFAIRHQLADLGYQEVVNMSFVEQPWEADFANNADPIRLQNPIASQLSVMRSTLIGSLVANVRYNLNRKAGRVRVFEVGAVFLRNPAVQDGPLAVAGFDQPKRVAAIAYGPAADEQWGLPTRAVDYFDVKGDLEALFAPRAVRFSKTAHPALHPGRSATVEVDGKVVGVIGELHPRWLQKYDLPQAPVLFEVDADALRARAVPAYAEISKFPGATRDLALVVKQDVPAQALVDAFHAELASNPLGKLVQAVVLFDEYRGKGLEQDEKSLAFRFGLQDTQSTLQDDAVEAIMAALATAAQQKHGAKLRA
jgi:phenylalanyl-tRNA synthetase beta chain